MAVDYVADATAAQATVTLIEEAGERVFAVQAEQGGPGSVERLLAVVEQGLVERTGAATIDILVNNAAVTGFTGAMPDAVTEETLDRCCTVNAQAPCFLIQKALRFIPDGGRVNNISSGMTPSAVPEHIAYALGEGALEQITRPVAPVLATREITINTVAPGVTNNADPVFRDAEALQQMAVLSVFDRVGTVSDIADVVACDDSRWITGAFIDASGGTPLR